MNFKRDRMRKIYCTKCKKYKEFKIPKISYICDKTSVEAKMKNYLKEKNQLKH